MKLRLCTLALLLLLPRLVDCVIFSWLWTVNPYQENSLSKHNSTIRNITTKVEKVLKSLKIL